MGSLPFWVPTTTEISKAKEAPDTKVLEGYRRRVNKLDQWARWFILLSVAGAALAVARVLFGFVFLARVPILFRLLFLLAIPILALFGLFMLNRAARARREIDRPLAAESVWEELRRVGRSLDRLIDSRKKQGSEQDSEMLLGELLRLRSKMEIARHELDKDQKALLITLSGISRILADLEKVPQP